MLNTLNWNVTEMTTKTYICINTEKLNEQFAHNRWS